MPEDFVNARGAGVKPDTSNFICRRCGECCRIKDGIVRISDKDVTAISAALTVSESDFIDRWCDIAPDRGGLVLKDADDGRSCIMLDESNRCRIYAARPEKCRTFPRDWVNDNSATYCPGLSQCITWTADSASPPSHQFPAAGEGTGDGVAHDAADVPTGKSK